MSVRQADLMVVADTEASWELRCSPSGTTVLVSSGGSAAPQEPPLLNLLLSRLNLAWLTSPSLILGERRDVVDEVTKVCH